MWASIFPFHQRSLGSDCKMFHLVVNQCESKVLQAAIFGLEWILSRVDFQFPPGGFQVCLCRKKANRCRDEWSYSGHICVCVYMTTAAIGVRHLCHSVVFFMWRRGRESFHFPPLDFDNLGTETHRDCKILGLFCSMSQKRKGDE